MYDSLVVISYKIHYYFCKSRESDAALIDLSPYIVDFRSICKEVTIRSPVGCKYRHVLRAKQTGSRVFFSVWRLVRPTQGGERGERLTNTLSDAKRLSIVRPSQDGERGERLTNTLSGPIMEDIIIRSAYWL